MISGANEYWKDEFRFDYLLSRRQCASLGSLPGHGLVSEIAEFKIHNDSVAELGVDIYTLNE